MGVIWVGEERWASGGGEVRRGANRLHKEVLDEGALISPFSTLHWQHLKVHIGQFCGVGS